MRWSDGCSRGQWIQTRRENHESSKKIYCRCVQFGFRLAIPFMPYRKPQIFSTFQQCLEVLKALKINPLLLVTDSFLRGSGATAGLEALLQEAGITCHVYDGTKPNPTGACAVYKNELE